jgi:hypothetical protein
MIHHEYEMLLAQANYWYSVVKKELETIEDWTFIEVVTEGLLSGTHNQHLMDRDELRYPVLIWRKITTKLGKLK